MRPYFSIITAVFNAEKTIGGCLDSVATQSFRDYEHIIVDGRSTDGTLSLIEKFNQKRLKILSEPDSGIYDAINKGIKLASGQYIGLLHSDDIFYGQETLSRVAKHLISTNPDVIYGNLLYVDSLDTERIRRRWKSGRYTKAAFRSGWMPPHPAVFFKKEFLDEIGQYRTDLRISGDYELLLRAMYLHSPSTVYLDEDLVRMRVGGVSNSTLKGRLTANQEDLKAWKVNGLSPPFLLRFTKPLRKINQFFTY
jgi:glycosyltransferase involved in cell wall biosynthesis